MRVVLLATATIVFLSACASAPKAPPAAPAGPTTHAAANLASASGSLVSGKITLVSMPGGAHITGVVGGLPANGKFGFHVHEKGDCSAVDATSADQDAVITAALTAVNASEIIWPAGYSNENKATAIAALEARQITVLAADTIPSGS